MASADELQILITTRDELSGKIKDAQKTVRTLTADLGKMQDAIDTPEGRRAWDKQVDAISSANSEVKRLRAEYAKTGRAIRDFGTDTDKAATKTDKQAAALAEANDKLRAMQAELRQTKTQLGQANGALERMSSKLAAVKGKLTTTTTAMDRLKAKTKEVRTAMDSSSLKTWAAGGAIAFGGLVTAAGLVGVKTAAGLEQSQIAFANLLGSTKQAQSMMGDLSKLAAETPFELPQLTTATQKLLAFGFKAEDIMPALTTIGDTAAGTGSGAEGIDRITMALGQMQAKGKITNEELMQLAELGVPVYDLLAKKLGMKKADVSAFLAMPANPKKGIISGAQDAYETLGGVQGLMDGMGKKYQGMMSEQSKSLSGLWSTLKDTFGLGMANLLQPYMDGIKGAVSGTINGLGGALKNLGRIIERVRPTVTRIFKFISDNKVPLMAAVGALAALTVGMVALNAAMALNPVTLIIVGIAALVGVLVAAYRRVGWFRDAVNASWAWIKRTTAAFAAWFAKVAWPKIKVVIGYVVGYFKSLWAVAKVVWRAILAAVKVYVAYFKAVAWPAIKWVASRIMDYWKMIAAVAKAVWPKVRDAVNSVRAWLTNTAAPAIKAFVGNVKTAFESAKATAQRVWNGVKTAVKGPIDTITTAVQNLKDLLSHLWDGVAKAADTAVSGIKSAWSGIKGALDFLPGFWHGGPVPAGTTAWVGELGPELWIPRAGTPRMVGADGPEVRNFAQPGFIVPHHLVPLVAPAPSSDRSAPAGHGGPLVSIGTINAAEGVDVEARVLHAMLRADRIKAERS